MKTALAMASKIRAGLLALAILGACELVAIDISANFFVIFGMGGSWIFLLATTFISIFSAAIMCFLILRLWLKHGAHYLDAAKTGAFVGLAASVGVCAAIVLFSLMGTGIWKIMPASVEKQGAGMIILFHLLACLLAMAVYGIAGAITGLLLAVASPHVEKKKQ